MKILSVLSLLAAALLVACASQSPYKSADGSRYGYSDSKIAGDRYRVTFTAPARREQQVRDYALLRAAELTLLNGYDWFVVVDRETRVDRVQDRTTAGVSAGSARAVSRDCGLLACRTYYHPVRDYGASIEAGTSSRGTARSALEIRLGKGVRPEGVESYSAQEVRRNLRRELELEEDTSGDG